MTETAPHAAGAGLIIAGITLNDWYLMLATGFVLIQIAYFLYTKIIKPWRDKHGRKQ